MPRWQMPSFGETKSKQRTEEERKKEQRNLTQAKRQMGI